jgi:hypothetical protein
MSTGEKAALINRIKGRSERFLASRQILNDSSEFS